MRRILALALLVSGQAVAQGLPIKDADSSTLAQVNATGAIEVIESRSTRATYRCTATGLATTALYNMSIESPAASGFKLVRLCIGASNATAAAAVTVTVNRRTTASSAGTAAGAESTATPSVSKMDPADGNFAGVCRITATLGTIGALLDGYSFQVGEIGAGTADTMGQDEFCKEYGQLGEKPPTALSGTTNGISINVSAPGAGGLASGSIAATFIVE